MTVEVAPHAMRQRHFHVAPWEITFGCGVVKLAIAIVALAWPLLRSNPIPSVVGWMLVIGGCAELLLSWSGRYSWIGRLTLGSGAVTIIAGAVFLNSEWTGLFPLTQCLVVWLLIRGILSIDVAVASWNTPTANWGWLLLRGIVDFGLGWLLLPGAIMAMMVWLFFWRDSRGDRFILFRARGELRGCRSRADRHFPHAAAPAARFSFSGRLRPAPDLERATRLYPAGR